MYKLYVCMAVILNVGVTKVFKYKINYIVAFKR